MPAVAMTDHGNLYGAVEFYQAARKAGIKPILGLRGLRRAGEPLRPHTGRGRAEALPPPDPARRDADGLRQPHPPVDPRLPRGVLLPAAHRQGAAARARRGAHRAVGMPRGGGPDLPEAARRRAGPRGAGRAGPRPLRPRERLPGAAGPRHSEEKLVNEGLVRLARGDRPAAGRHQRLPLPAARRPRRSRRAGLHQHGQEASTTPTGCTTPPSTTSSRRTRWRSASPGVPEALENTLAIAERCNVAARAGPDPGPGLPGPARRDARERLPSRGARAASRRGSRDGARPRRPACCGTRSRSTRSGSPASWT